MFVMQLHQLPMSYVLAIKRRFVELVSNVLTCTSSIRDLKTNCVVIVRFEIFKAL